MHSGAIARPTTRSRWYLRLAVALLLPILGAVYALGTNSVHARDSARLRAELEALDRWDSAVDVLESGVPAAQGAVRAFRLTGAQDRAYLGAFDDFGRETSALIGELRQGSERFPALEHHTRVLDETVPQLMDTLERLRDVPAGDVAAEREAARAEWQAAQTLFQAIVAGEAVAEGLIEAREEALAATDAARGRAWMAVPLGFLVTIGMAIRMVRQSERRVRILTRNTANLVEGRALEPFPYAGDQLDELGVAVERTAELLDTRERDRVAAHQEADRANHAKTAFLSRMSHELRTPLTAVLGFAELLEMDDLSDQQRDSVRQIRKAGAHLLSLINEVLDISRIESGNLQVSIEPMELGAVIGDALTIIRPLAEERGIRLPRACGHGVYVRADRQRVTQVLLNLLSNAVKYNREFGEVRLRCLVEDERVHVVVTDTGMGIAPELLPRVFAPFDRLGAEQRGIEGTGVGLVLSKGLVEAMGGELTLESRPGEGSSFTFSLPGTARPAVIEAADPLVGAQAPRPGRDIRVLYVEDNQANIDLVSGFLSRRPGVQVITTMQGRMALDLARAHQPDVVLLDLHLPDLDGESVLRELRSHPETADLRVVMVTADATSRQENRLRALGADDYVTKPLDFSRLMRLVEHTETEVRT